MKRTATLALMQAVSLPAEAPVTDWVHLLPAGDITTQDGRGPYRVADPAALMAASLPEGTKLPIDENHAIDLAAPRGEASPARGWIVELQARADGIWGRVEWSETGKVLLTERAYLGLSPAIHHDATGRIQKILRASLVNRPNLRGLTALHQQQDITMNELLAKLKQMLGLEADAEDEQIWRSLNAVIDAATAEKAKAAAATALQSQMAEIGVALGVPDASAEAMIEAAKALHAAQAEAATLSQRLATFETQQKRERAVAWMDSQIAAKRMIGADRREGLIALHMQDPEQAEQIAGLYPSGDLASLPTAAPAPLGDPSLHQAADGLVGKARALQAAEAAKGVTLSWIDAVHRASEQK
ncbi:MAG: phage protease [Paracoccaceae bacterium]